MGTYADKLRRRFSQPGPLPATEQREREPHLTLDFYFSRHETAHDAEMMRPQFEKADIFVPEGRGYTLAVLQLLRDVSAGRVSPDDAQRVHDSEYNTGGVFSMEKLRMLAGTQKLVVLIDQPFRPEQETEMRKEQYCRGAALGQLFFGELQKALNLTRSSFSNYVQRQHAREQYMFQELQQQIGGEQLQAWCQRRMKEKHSPEIRVLLQLGASHTRLAHWAERRLPHQVEHQMQTQPYIFPPFDAEYRKFIFGKKREFDDETCLHVLVNTFVNTYLRAVFPRSERHRIDETGRYESQLEQRIVRAISREDMEQFALACRNIQPTVSVHDFASTRQLSRRQLEQIIRLFDVQLQRHGFALPTDEQSWLALVTH